MIDIATGLIRPRQKKPKSEKDFEWFKQCADYFIAQATFDFDIDKYYALDEGMIFEEDYETVLYPFHDETISLVNKKELRHYPILKPLKNLFLGEFQRVPKDFPIGVNNSDFKLKVSEISQLLIEKNVVQQMINTFNKGGYPTGMESKEVQQPQQIQQKVEANELEDRVIKGQILINDFKKAVDYYEKVNLMYEDALRCGRAFCYTDVDDFQHIDPRDVWVGFSPSSPYAEDGNIQVWRQRMTLSEILDKYHDDLKEENIDWLETESGHFDFDFSKAMFIWNTRDIGWSNSLTNYYKNLDGTNIFTLYHVFWKGMVLIKQLAYINFETGQEETVWVDEDYKLNKEVGDIEFRGQQWVNRVYKQTRISDALSGIYINGGELKVQRSELKNHSICKLPINGRVDLDSLYKECFSYQLEYNILWLHIRKTLSNAFASLTSLPTGLKPDEFADTITWIMFAKDTGFLPVDESSPHASKAMELFKTIQGYFYDHIKALMEITQKVYTDMWDSQGVNPQRYGDIATGAGKATTEQALFRSTTISLRGVNKFTNLLRVEEQCILDFTKVRSADGFRGSYLDNNKVIKYIEINPIDYAETEYTVFASDVSEEKEKMDAAMSYIQPMIQNGQVDAKTAFEVIDNIGSRGNFAKVKQTMKEFSEQLKQMQQQKEQADRDAAMQVEQVKEANAEKQRIFDKDLQREKLDSQEKIARMNLEAKASETIDENEELRKQKKMNIEEERLNLDKQRLQNENLKRENENSFKERKLQQTDKAMKIQQENKKVSK